MAATAHAVTDLPSTPSSASVSPAAASFRLRLGAYRAMSVRKERPCAPQTADCWPVARLDGEVRGAGRLAGQGLVFDAMRLVGICAQAFFPIDFVVGEVALKPPHFAVALKREHVRGDPIQKPTIV